MFEKEAEEYATRDVFFDGVPEPVINHQRKEDWQKGAEFGYKQGLHEGQSQLTKAKDLIDKLLHCGFVLPCYRKDAIIVEAESFLEF